MTDEASVIAWMMQRLRRDGCLYQDDVIDHIVKSKLGELTRENADGNVVLGNKLLKTFAAATDPDVVWVRPDRYWRYRVKEDEPGREASG